MTTSILIHLATGFEETEAVTIIDVLRRANLNVTTVSITGSLKVTGAHNIAIEADQLYDEADYPHASMIVLPGGMPGTTNLLNHSGLTGQLKLFNGENRYIAAICAAPMILGSLGFLEGKNAVCYPGFESKLTGATVLFSPFAVDGNLITGRGVGTALDFSLEIVRILKGEKLASDLRTALVIP
jgi:4-methyl-5(b-hydroxyethyl)-thiazole monophosphate biosynthesis